MPARISAVPVPDPRVETLRTRILLTGDVPNPMNPPPGCRFRTRCLKFANELSVGEQQQCIEDEPALIERGQGHPAACHFADLPQFCEGTLHPEADFGTCQAGSPTLGQRYSD
jgi:oligopeptide transport system ATP-binding protein